MSSHLTSVDGSDRLKDLLAILMDGKEHSNRELRTAIDSAAIHSDIDDLRNNGYIIHCRYAGLSEKRKRIYMYHLCGYSSEYDRRVQVA